MTGNITLENVLKQCGDFGRYQLMHYLFLNLITIVSGIATYYYMFGLAEPVFQCQPSSSTWPSHVNRYDLLNVTHQLTINRNIMPLSSKCNDINGLTCTDFIFDRSVFGRTFTEDANFVCTRAMMKTWLSTFYQIGGFVVILTGWIGDKIGRRKLIQILNIGLFLITLLTQLLIQFVNMTVDAKFGLLLINQFVLGVDAYSMVFLLLMELTSSAHTSFAGNLALVSFALGEILVTVLAYIARDWLRLRWFIIGYFSLVLPYLYFVPESPYWLLSQKKYNQLENCLRKIAKGNNRMNHQWFPQYTELIQNTRMTMTKKKHATTTTTTRWEKIMPYLPRLIMSSLISFVTMIVYFKISFGLAMMNETVSPYWNTIIGAVVESIGYVSASVLINTCLGRKYALIIYMLSTLICVFVIPFFMKSYPVFTIIVSQMGKLTISGGLCIAWIYAPELFPTSIRGLANGIFVFAGRIGAILAPIIETKFSVKYMKMTFFIYSALILVTSGIVYFLPETRNRSFHNEDEDNIFRNSIDSNGEESSTAEAAIPLQSDTIDVSHIMC